MTEERLSDAAWEAWISEPGRATTNFGWYALGYAAGQARTPTVYEEIDKAVKAWRETQKGPESD